MPEALTIGVVADAIFGERRLAEIYGRLGKHAAARQHLAAAIALATKMGDQATANDLENKRKAIP